jgi:predicted RNA-binding Zn-ribbon protein involved in translation (DUF1610 family)
MEIKKEEVDLKKCVTCGRIFLARDNYQKECPACLTREALLEKRIYGQM